MVKKGMLSKNQEKTVHMSFDVPMDLRNAFKAKVASQGKLVKEVFVVLMEEYIRKK